MTLPHKQPVKPVRAREPFDSPEWLYELKNDGYRGVLYRETDSCILLSKNNKHLQYPDLVEKLASRLRRQDVILDGEVCSLNEDGLPVFLDLRRHVGHIVFVAFDILWLNGKDLTDLPLLERKEILERFRPKEKGEYLQVTTWIRGEGIKLFNTACERDLEGIVAKRLDGVYSRRTRWLKIINPNYSQTVGRFRLFMRKLQASRP